jgi:hypothetical protein
MRKNSHIFTKKKIEQRQNQNHWRALARGAEPKRHFGYFAAFYHIQQKRNIECSYW